FGSRRGGKNMLRRRNCSKISCLPWIVLKPGAEYVGQKLGELGLYFLPSPLPPKRCGNYPVLSTVDLDM
ncbi:hypothetical protein ACJ73_03875, partial [Blastomyces percursus]